MRYAIALLLLMTAYGHAQVPPCAGPLPVCEAGERPPCTLRRACLDAQGCEHDQIIHTQDCSATPRPAYCSDKGPTFLLRDRKTCPTNRAQ